MMNRSFAWICAKCEQPGLSRRREVGDGRSAVNLARELKPEIVVMDIKFEGEEYDGIDAARVLTKKRSLRAPLDGYSQRELVARAREAGVVGYLVKPFRESDLAPAIEVALARFEEFKAMEKQVGGLQDALETRKFVDRAKGILMDTRSERGRGVPQDPEDEHEHPQDHERGGRSDHPGLPDPAAEPGVMQGGLRSLTQRGTGRGPSNHLSGSSEPDRTSPRLQARARSLAAITVPCRAVQTPARRPARADGHATPRRPTCLPPGRPSSQPRSRRSSSCGSLCEGNPGQRWGTGQAESRKDAPCPTTIALWPSLPATICSIPARILLQMVK